MSIHKKAILRKADDWRIASVHQALRLKEQGFTPIAVAPNKVQAAQMIVGLRSDELVETLLGHLDPDHKVIVKTEIACIATDLAQAIS